MSIELRVCPECGLISARVPGNSEWRVWQRRETVTAIKDAYNVVHEEQAVCFNCEHQKVTIAAGEVT